MVDVISGATLKGVRARSNLSNQQLADLLDESLSTVNRWLANGVRAEKEAKVRERLAVWLPPSEPDRYTQMSDAALLAEMTRLLGIIGQRLADREQRPPMQQPLGETAISDVNTGEEQSSQEPGGGSTTTGQRRIRGRGPRRNLGQ